MKQNLNRYLTRNLEEDQVELEVDLKSLFPSKKFTDREKDVIAQLFIDKVAERAAKGLDIHGRKLPNYSESYSESAEFRAFGKSQENPNMRLTGDMIDQLEPLDASKDKIKIGWTEQLQNAKAHGNITGQNGAWDKKRDFFGLSVADIEQIKKEVKELIDG
jgi:hypothetical protein